MRFPLYIARRFMLGGKGAGPSRLTGWIAILGLAVGCFALVLAVAVLKGFEHRVSAVIAAFEGDLRISAPAGQADLTAIATALEAEPDLQEILPFQEREGLLLGDVPQMVRFKAVDPARLEPFYRLELETLPERGSPPSIREPDSQPDWGLPLSIREPDSHPDQESPLSIQDSDSHPGQESTPDIVIGQLLADRLNLLPGDLVSVMSPIDQPHTLGIPPRYRCRVGAIFSSRVLDYDDRLAFIPRDLGRRLFRRKTGWDGIDIRLQDPGEKELVKARLVSRLPPGARVQSWEDLHAGLFSAMRLERVGALVALSLIILVACFNLAATLVLVTAQKISEIGILRTLGTSAGGIRRILLTQGLLIGSLGTAVGTALGLGLTWAQNTWDIIPLPQEVYSIPYLPMLVKSGDVAVILAIALGLVLLSSLLAANRAVTIQPREAVYYQK